MERTNYVDKAKSLMLKTARTTALVIMPLAAAVSAHAGSIVASNSVALPSGNVSCSTNVVSGSCQGGDMQLADLGSGVQGLSFFTSGGFGQTFFLSSGSGEIVQMTLADSGTLGGTIPAGTMIPVAWNFTMAGFSGATIQSWNLGFELGSLPGFTDYGAVSGSGTGGGTVSGSAILNVPGDISGGNTLYETVLLSMTVDVAGFGGVTVTVPNNTSWDFQSVAASSVPEPASLGLIGAGLAFFGALIRRRRKQ